MKLKWVLACVLLGLCVCLPARAKELKDLKVLYVGSERTGEYMPFLKEYVAEADAVERDSFDPSDGASYDVVLLDWPQGGPSSDMKHLRPPLGARATWNKPTVLLGSAGLLLAASWELRGGIGCTCLDPMAFDLRDHELFEGPFPIDRSTMISIPTPADFEGLIDGMKIDVLPLVADTKRAWSAGWCTYSSGFTENPDIEYFCGGVNAKTPTAAALWRQGNLMHFGFEQSPVEMNEQGRNLLLNSIAYISRFSEDRPIAHTPSVFVQPTARSREALVRWLETPGYPIDLPKNMVVPEVWKRMADLPDRNAMIAWAREHGPYLRPDSEMKWEMDEDLVALGVPFDQPAFFDRAIAALLSKDGAAVARATRLLTRYALCGPEGFDPDGWAAWWKENKDFVFGSDAGDYRWYIDPLAKKRGIPTATLRGPLRADK